MEKEYEVNGVQRQMLIDAIQSKIDEKSMSLRLHNGDVITAVNGKTVKNVMEFYREVAAAKKSINFDVYNNGGTITTGTYKF